MPSVYSKTLPYSCHELGHTWNASCAHSSLDIFISAFLYSCKMYSFIYAATAAFQYKELSSLRNILVLLKNYLRSALFLSTNAVGYIGFFCVLRKLLGHVNYGCSFIPGFFSALLAILVERPSRRSLLAVYVANVASECAFNAYVGWGYVKPVPYGDVLLFCSSLAVLGYCYHSSTTLPPLLDTLFKHLVGEYECGLKEPCKQHASYSSLISVSSGLSNLVGSRGRVCPHPKGCLEYITKTSISNASKALLASYSLSLVFSLKSLVKNPLSTILKKSKTSNHVRLAAAVAWFCGMFKLVCCLSRRVSSENLAIHGAIAGAVAGLGTSFYRMKSLASYTTWKTVETVCKLGVSKGFLPHIPMANEMLYTVMTAYLFHVAALYQHYMKPSYWTMLMNLTDNKMGEFNRHLLQPYLLDSGRNFSHFWPDYDSKNLSSHFRHQHAGGLSSIPSQFSQ